MDKTDSTKRMYETHGMSKSPEHSIWRELRKRCYTTTHARYADYGGRGITVCDRWCKSFLAFYEDVGPRPSPEHSIDRIDNDGNYEPGNVRWAVRSEQQRNTRQNRILMFAGKTMCLTEWVENTGIAAQTLRSRLNRGWSVDRALNTPVKHRSMAPHRSTP